MKETKKEIFARYGIELIDNNHVNSPLGPITKLLIDGNGKIGKGVYHFSTVPGTYDYSVSVNGTEYTAKGTCPCNCKGCYAMSGNYTRYGYDAPAMRTVIARNYSEFMVKAIIAQIKADNIKFVRIHASGDFFSSEYVNAWTEIIKACPECTFWTYTKNGDAVDAFDGLENANIVKSVIPHIGFNFGHIDYIIAVYNELKRQGKSVYICRCGIDKNQHCNNCKACSKHEFVLFIEHSTEYKAEKDPRYEEIKALIESQESMEF